MRVVVTKTQTCDVEAEDADTVETCYTDPDNVNIAKLILDYGPLDIKPVHQAYHVTVYDNDSLIWEGSYGY